MNYTPGSYITSGSEAAVKDPLGVEVRLAGVDLNLLIALEALLTHQNVTLAARKIGQTQPAMSRALARLRDLLDDDLLVRGANGLQLTTRGAHLARRLPATMAQVREVCHLRETESRVALSVNEHLSPLLLPGLLDQRPHGNTPLRIGTHDSPQQALDQLQTRAADFVLGAGLPDDSGMASQMVFRDAFVTLVAPDAVPDTAAFLARDHARISGEAFPQVAAALTGAGLVRARLVEVPDIMSAALLAAQGSLALTVPQCIAKWLQLSVDLRAVASPVPIAGYELQIGWLEHDLQVTHRSLLDRLGRFASAALENAGRAFTMPAAHA